MSRFLCETMRKNGPRSVFGAHAVAVAQTLRAKLAGRIGLPRGSVWHSPAIW